MEGLLQRFSEVGLLCGLYVYFLDNIGLICYLMDTMISVDSTIECNISLI